MCWVFMKYERWVFSEFFRSVLNAVISSHRLYYPLLICHLHEFGNIKLKCSLGYILPISKQIVTEILKILLCTETTFVIQCH